MCAAPVTAEGDLGKTPFAHLLVYALERRLTGAMFLADPSGATHVVRFARGAPVKARPGDDFARLGELLVEQGLVSAEDLAVALGSKGLLGEALVYANRLDQVTLRRALDDQLRRRIRRLFSLPAETTYQYLDGHFELLDWGGEPASLDPLSLLWDGLRAHAECSTKFEATVAQFSRSPLSLHPRAPAWRLGLEGAELMALECMQDQPTTVDELLGAEIIDAASLGRLIYVLAITRQLDMGPGVMPVAADEPRDSTSTPVGGISKVGRVQLVTAAVRAGAAAPDLPGDGERGPVTPIRRRKRGADEDAPESAPSVTALSGAQPIPDPPASQPLPREPVGAEATPSAEAPVSSVFPIGSVAAGDPLATSPGPPAQADEPSAAPGLYATAQACVAEQNFDGARTACARACRADPVNVEYAAFSAWLRAMSVGADVKAIAIELDELLGRAEAHPRARYYRALIRKRLGDGVGAARDLRRALELEPGFADAARELAALEPAAPKAARGLLGRLFKR